MRTTAILFVLFAIFLLGIAGCDQEAEPGAAGGGIGPAGKDGGDGDGTPGATLPSVLAGEEKASGKACEKVPLEPMEMPDLDLTPPVVELDANGFFVVNGTPFFPYGFYYYPTDPSDMEEFVTVGFNHTVSIGSCCSETSLPAMINKLTYLAGYDVMAAPHCFSPGQLHTTPEETILEWIEQRTSIGNVLFWYTYDEPGIWSKPYEEVEEHYLALKELDPDRPNALVMAPAEEFTEYLDYTDFLMVDPYPVPHQPLAWVKYTVLEAHAASNYEKAVFGVPQAFDWYHNWGTAPEGHIWRPFAWEMRNMTYQMMVFGVNGMAYFKYSGVHGEPERWDGLKEVAVEVVELMPILVEPISEIAIEETTGLEYVDHSLREHDGLYYLMIISTWGNDVEVTYDLSPLGTGLCVLNYFTEETFDVAEDGTLTLELAQYQEAVLQIFAE